MSADDRDYVTVQGTAHPHKYLTVVMEYYKPDDGYRIKKASNPLREDVARFLAESWAAALQLEYRP